MPLWDWKIPFETEIVLQTLKLPEDYVKSITYTNWATVAKARNILVNNALDQWADYLLFLDDDNPPEQLDFIEQMIKADKDIVCWLIRQRRSPYRLCIREKIINDFWWPEYVNYTHIQKVDNWLQPIKIDACWTWCVLIKRKVLEEMRQFYQNNIFETKLTTYMKTKDWKFTEYIAQNHSKLIPDLSDWVCRMHTAQLSEDILFCDRATSHWFEVRCLPYVTCWHISEQMIWVWEETFINPKLKKYA